MRDFMRKKRQHEIDVYRSSQAGTNSIGSAERSIPSRTDPKGHSPGRQIASVVTSPQQGSVRLATRSAGTASPPQSYSQQQRLPSDALIPQHSFHSKAPTTDSWWSLGSAQAHASNVTRYGNPHNSLSTIPGDPFASLTLRIRPHSSEQVLIHHCKFALHTLWPADVGCAVQRQH